MILKPHWWPTDLAKPPITVWSLDPVISQGRFCTALCTGAFHWEGRSALCRAVSSRYHMQCWESIAVSYGIICSVLSTALWALSLGAQNSFWAGFIYTGSVTALQCTALYHLHWQTVSSALLCALHCEPFHWGPGPRCSACKRWVEQSNALSSILVSCVCINGTYIVPCVWICACVCMHVEQDRISVE